MNLDKLPHGKNAPNDISLVIEIPSHGLAVKYEVNQNSGTLTEDCFMITAMFYTCNYGFMPHTLSADADSLEALQVTPIPLISGSVIGCRWSGAENCWQ